MLNPQINLRVDVYNGYQGGAPKIRVFMGIPEEEYRIETQEIMDIIKKKIERYEYAVTKEPRQKYKRIVLTTTIK